MPFLRFTLLLAAILLPTLAAAGDLPLAALADAYLQRSGAPGVAIAVQAKGEDRAQSLARGIACLNHRVPLDDQATMKLGSVTKVFTAIRIQMLVEAGRLDYETPVSRFFPDFPRGREIRVRHLLAHTSGLHEILDLEPFHSNLARAWTASEQLAVLARTPLDFTPGTRQKYSNSGYLLLGMIIEKLTGQPYDRQILQQIAGPLGLTGLQGGDDTTVQTNAGCGYSSAADGSLCLPMMASRVSARGTGNLLGRAQDVAGLVNLGRLVKGNLIDHPPTGPHLLDNGQPAVKHENIIGLVFDLSYHNGLATFDFPARDLHLIGKAGMFPGFASWFLYDPGTETAVAVLTNLETKSMEAMQLAIDVFEARRHQDRAARATRPARLAMTASGPASKPLRASLAKEF